MASETLCPVCNASSDVVKKLSADFLEEKLRNYYGVDSLDEKLDLCDYDLMRCVNCSLEFGFPLKPGSNNFYEWITSKPGYYPPHRWEWDIVIEQITNQGLVKASLLEVGCGSGAFLEILKPLSSLRSMGVDTTDTSIKKCYEKGLSVSCETLDSFLEGNEDVSFDYAVSFHCLEHVPDPKKLVESMKSAINQTGSIFISTPYSPMSFETNWFDPLNHPPHHLSRWNKKAYQELGIQLGLNVNFYMPKPSNSLSRAMRALNYEWFGPAHAKPTRQLFLAALSKPTALVSEYLRQLQREKLDLHVAADTVLVKLDPIVG
jgi:2-polyprenyl-3-methyl-5-hydroxy-6-metoxy-1,4-benzoquinol methylase